jgi:acyl carrier protein
LQNTLAVIFRSGDQATVKNSSTEQQPNPGRSKQLEGIALPAAAPEFQILQQALSAVPQTQRAALIAQFLSNKIALLLKLDKSAVLTNSSIRSLGLDSLKVVELKHALDQVLNIDAPLSLFLSDDSLEKLAEKLSETAESSAEYAVNNEPADDSDNRQKALSKGRGLGEGKSKALYNTALSSTQLSMWTMQQLEPNSIVYNLHLALRIAGKLEQERLKQAFHHLTDRHTMLRTVYRADDNDEIIQQVLPTSELPDSFTAVDASSWPESQLQDDMARRAREPFDLETGPLLRITCYVSIRTQPHPMSETPSTDSGRRVDPSNEGVTEKDSTARARNDQSLFTETCHTLLICAHHIAVDLWSVLIFVSELKTIYAELSLSREPLLNNLNSSYTDFVAWQRHYLNSPACDKAWNYWHRQLTGDLPLLSLPTDSPRSAVSDYRGASVAFRLNRDNPKPNNLKNWPDSRA